MSAYVVNLIKIYSPLLALGSQIRGYVFAQWFVSCVRTCVLCCVCVYVLVEREITVVSGFFSGTSARRGDDIDDPASFL